MTILTPCIVEPPPVISSPAEDSAELPVPVYVGGVPVHPVGVAGLLAWAKATIARGQRGRVSYANAHNVLLAAEQADYRAALEQADLVFCDGYGVWGASRWLGTPLPERMTLPDWSEQLFAIANDEGWSLFFLGGKRGVAEAARARLRDRYPSLEITVRDGYFDMEGPENDAVLEAIRSAKPTVLLIGMGPPRQELWITTNHQRHNAALTVAVGCLFDYMGGTLRRGPHWLTARGGEWLWRLAWEPRRLWRRYLLGNPRFLWHVLRNRDGVAERG